MSAKKLIVAFCTVSIFCIISYGQEKNVLEGIIRDASDQNYISNAYIYTNSGVSTVTDSLGGFKLSYPGQGLAYIVISHIRYQNDTIFTSQVQPGQRIEVNLISRATHLNEVVVYDVYDPALILMRKVIESIPKNYNRDGCSSHYALIRESLQLKENDSIPLYLIETTIKDYASPESNKLDYKVDVLNARTFINHDYHNFSKIGLTGTAFINEKYNPVLTLAGPLASSNNEKKYTFSIIDTSHVSNEEFIKIEFKRNKSSTSYQGHLIINSSDFSISEFHLSRSKENAFLLEIDAYKKRQLKLYINYKKAGTYYDVHEIEVYQEYFPYKREALVSKGHYLNLENRSCELNHQINIPLNRDDVLMEELRKKKVPGWKPSSMAETKKYDYLFEQETIPGRQKVEDTQKKSIKSRLRLGYQVPLWIMNVSDFNVRFQNPNVFLIDSVNADKSVGISIATIISYEIGGFALIEFGGFSSFRKNNFSSTFLNLQYEWRIDKEATSLLSFGVRASYFKQRVFLQKISNSDAFSVNGKKFDSGKFETYFEQRSFTISPIVTYLHKIGRSAYLEFGGFLPINTFMKNGIFLIENDSFFKRKRAFTGENLTITPGDEVLISNIPNLFFGIRWKLK